MFAIGGKKDQAKAAALRAAPKSASKTSGGSVRPSNHPKLSMYTETPSADISLETFEAFALDRMRVLKAIDDGLSRGKKPAEMEQLMNEETGKHLKITDVVPGDFSTLGGAPLSKDEVSHFALRMAYCRTDELRRWFLQNECTLFKHKFDMMAPNQKADFLKTHDMGYQPVTVEEFTQPIKDGIRDTIKTFANKEADDIMAKGANGFYKVPFEEVFDLVRSRRVYLSGGSAYVPQKDLTSLVVGVFRSRLSKATAMTSRRWAQHVAGEEKDRLAPVIMSLSKRYIGRDYGKQGANGEVSEVITLKDLNKAAAESFPLCAKHLFRKMKEDHHLRHEGRRQLQLYLKGIGLALEEAMLFWKTEFCKKIPAEKFEKEYAYAVRHAYGKEGKRVDYTPHTCMKCIAANPGGGENHGCPFKTFGEEGLRAALSGMQIKPNKVNEIVDKAKGQHYQLACGMTFEATHEGKTIDAGVQHPNQYFSESRKALGYSKGEEGEGVVSPEKVPVTPGQKAVGVN